MEMESFQSGMRTLQNDNGMILRPEWFPQNENETLQNENETLQNGSGMVPEWKYMIAELNQNDFPV